MGWPEIMDRAHLPNIQDLCAILKARPTQNGAPYLIPNSHTQDLTAPRFLLRQPYSAAEAD